MLQQRYQVEHIVYIGTAKFFLPLTTIVTAVLTAYHHVAPGGHPGHYESYFILIEGPKSPVTTAVVDNGRPGAMTLPGVSGIGFYFEAVTLIKEFLQRYFVQIGIVRLVLPTVALTGSNPLHQRIELL